MRRRTSSDTPPIVLRCACGESVSLPASAGGLTIECPRCGRNLRAPTWGLEAELDVELVNRLVGRPLAPHRLLLTCQGMCLAASIPLALAGWFLAALPWVGVVSGLGAGVAAALGLRLAAWGARRQARHNA